MAEPLFNPALLPGHRQNRGAGLVAVYATTLAVAAIMVAVRLYVRKFILKKLWWDDLFVVIGLVGQSIGSNVVILPISKI